MDLTLLISETLLYLAFSVVLFRKERVYGVFILLLYIYAIFTQIGYHYVPELSMSLYAYFGEQIWEPVTFFIISSGIALFFYLWLGSDRVMRLFHRTLISHLQVSERRQNTELIILVLIGVTLLIETVIFITQFGSISWENAQKEDIFSAAPAIGVFILMVKLSVGINLALYCLLRHPSPKTRRIRLASVFFCSMLLFLCFTFKLGNRTDDVAIVMGIVVFETSQIRLRPRHFAIAAAMAAVAVLYLNFLEAHRYEDGPVDVDLVTRIVLKDYYFPAHILFAAVANEMVTPGQVLQSNAGNALMFFGQPYLQAGVMNSFYPGGATRNASYGFYPFTEGYLVVGYAGFIYNAAVLGTLLIFWRSMATTNSKRLNGFLMAVLGSMLVNLVRGQSSYYVKYLYTFILPNTMVYLLLSGQKITWTLRTRKRAVNASPPHDISLSATT